MSKINKREKKRALKKLQQEIRNNYYMSKMIKVDDPEMWCPAYPNNQVELNLGLFYSGTHEFSNTYLYVSGMDDTALEMRFSSSDLEELKEKWHKLKSIYDSIPLTTNWQWFLDKGFTFG